MSYATAWMQTDCVTEHKIADILQVSWWATDGLTDFRAEKLQRRQQCATVLSKCSQADRLLAESCSGLHLCSQVDSLQLSWAWQLQLPWQVAAALTICSCNDKQSQTRIVDPRSIQTLTLQPKNLFVIASSAGQLFTETLGKRHSFFIWCLPSLPCAKPRMARIVSKLWNMKQALYTDEKVEENDFDLDTKRDRWNSWLRQSTMLS